MIKRFTMNPRGRDLLIGDIHGHFDKAMASLKAVGFNPMFDRVFALGDLVDRGPQSEDVLDWLNKPWFHSVRGNHEQFALMDLDPRFRIANGGAWFVGMPDSKKREYMDAFEDMPVAIELMTEYGRIGLVHADEGGMGWDRLTMLLERPDEHPGVVAGCLEGRSRFERMDESLVTDVRAVVVGHNPVERITSLGNVIFLDTGAWKPENKDKPFAILDAATLSQAYDPRADFWGETR